MAATSEIRFRDLHRDMGALSSSGSWYVLLINSVSHGVFNVVERMDEEFFASHLGPGQYDVIKTGDTVLSGTRQGWDELRDFISSVDFSNQANFEELVRRGICAVSGHGYYGRRVNGSGRYLTRTEPICPKRRYCRGYGPTREAGAGSRPFALRRATIKASIGLACLDSSGTEVCSSGCQDQCEVAVRADCPSKNDSKEKHAVRHSLLHGCCKLIMREFPLPRFPLRRSGAHPSRGAEQ